MKLGLIIGLARTNFSSIERRRSQYPAP